MAQAAVINQATRFCGTVDPSNVDKSRLEEYGVNRWIADTESRISAAGITDERKKIDEALLYVSMEHGDAHTVLHSVLFRNITLFNEFKKQCLQFWQPEAQKDPWYNIGTFHHQKYEGNHLVLATRVEEAIDRVTTDMKAVGIVVGRKDEFDDDETDLASISKVLRYMSLGPIYDALGKEERVALKKYCDRKPNDGIVQTLMYIERKVKQNSSSSSADFTGTVASGNPRNNSNQSNRNQSGQARSRYQEIEIRLIEMVGTTIGDLINQIETIKVGRQIEVTMGIPLELMEITVEITGLLDRGELVKAKIQGIIGHSSIGRDKVVEIVVITTIQPRIVEETNGVRIAIRQDI
ncbi:uncharacterized protein [Macrobrachium rosenbergii]|uniref:uncharacterized protein isoform X2 n=1 Tax=Macrobrachium rosenbergii TaxID=79674 RepID=UPI0034D5533B